MIISLLYLGSFIAFLIACLLYPKIENMNFVTGVMLSYVTTLCYGAVGASLLQICSIPIKLQGMSALYLIGAVILFLFISRRRKVQKFSYRIFDFVVLLIGLLLFGRLAVHIFSRHVNINYVNMADPGNHFVMAMRVARGEKLTGMYFSALHNAMFINMLLPVVPATWSYKLFILSDCFHNLMELYFFYGFMVYIEKSEKHKWFPVIVSALYWYGYPLYSFARGGYVYWAMGGMLVQYILCILRVYEKNTNLRKLCLPLLLLGCFGVTVCYIQFAPAIFIAVAGVLFYHKYAKKTIVLDRKLINQIVIMGVIACICAITGYYFVFYTRNIDLFAAFKLGSNTSRNLEFFVAFPIIYYICYILVKEKKLNAYIFSLFSFLAIQCCFTVFAAINKVSSYYLFKPYYIFWSLIWIIFLSERRRFVGKVKKYTLNYLIIAVIFLMFAYVPQQDREVPEIYSLDNSMWRNNTILVKRNFRNPYLSVTKVELMEYVYHEWDANETKVSLLGTNALKGVCAWYEGITNQPGYWLSPLTQEDIEAYLEESGTEYVAVFTDSDAYECNAEYLDSFEKVYSNEEGFIVKVR